MRRLRALALLDPDVGAVIAARDQRRQQGLTVLAGRLAPGPGHTVRVLMMLTSFETFDTLAGPQDITAAIPDILRLAETVLGQGAGGATPGEA